MMQEKRAAAHRRVVADSKTEKKGIECSWKGPGPKKSGGFLRRSAAAQSIRSGGSGSCRHRTWQFQYSGV